MSDAVNVDEVDDRRREESAISDPVFLDRFGRQTLQIDFGLSLD